MTRIPALDGLRAVSMALVVAYHTLYVPGAYIGVDVFFILSGFLITRLFILEHATTGTISIANFYIRRTLRLMPALWLLVGSVLIQQWIARQTQPQFPLQDIGTVSLYALAYVENWYLIGNGPAAPGNIFQHTWSLAVEEQFYLVWAIVAYGLLRHASPGRVRSALFALFVAALAWRASLWWLDAGQFHVAFGSDAKAHELMAGALLATITPVALSDRQARILTMAAAIAGTSLLSIALFARSLQGAPMTLCWEVACIAATSVIIADIVFDPTGPASALLSHPWLVYLGSISYGVYLWHYPINNLLKYTPLFTPVAQLLIAGGGGILMAALSYELMERRIVRLRARLQLKGESARSGSVVPSSIDSGHN